MEKFHTIDAYSLSGSTKERILNSLVFNVEGAKFLPADQIEIFTTSSGIDLALEEETIHITPDLLKFASGEGKRVFLTLAYIRNLRALDSLRQARFKDSYLPIGLKKKSYNEIIKQGHGKIIWHVSSLDEGSGNAKPERLAVFDNISNWNDQFLELFRDSQWLFLAPVFTKNCFQYSFHPRRPLPFVSKGGSDKISFFSHVRQYRIHDAHQLVLDQLDKPMVALKELRQGEDAYFQRESDTLKVISALNNRHLIKPIAAYHMGNSLCFLFPWADGGNLRELWSNAGSETEPAPALLHDTGLVLWAVEQMYGLADALNSLYNVNGRHGDLKPENVLWFRERQGWGTLQIADVGLAKFHTEATRHRNGPTATISGTFRYQPPECDDIETHTARSRDYDIWSLGCIYLEFVTWLLDGRPGLEAFNKPGRFRNFWDSKDGSYVVHTAVQESMTNILGRLSNNQGIFAATLKAIVELIKARLLQVRLAEDGIPRENHRANAAELFDCMTTIYKGATSERAHPFDESISRQDKICGTPAKDSEPNITNKQIIPAISLDYSPKLTTAYAELIITPPTAGGDGTQEDSFRRLTMQAREQDYNIPEFRTLNDEWVSKPDNDFARKLLKKISLRVPTSILCQNCKNLNLWSAGFRESREVANLKECGIDCNLCSLLYQSALECGLGESSDVDFYREESTIKIGPDCLPLLSVYTDPESSVNAPPFAQIGFPILPEQGGPEQSMLLGEWLRSCNETHSCLPKHIMDGNGKVPTRVICVGDQSNKGLRLIQGRDCEDRRYIALSHCWGGIDDSLRFCTYRDNIAQQMDQIDIRRLPATYTDAIKVTRDLGILYLWIDAICIIQNDEDDWRKESSQMENVFSQAYVTLAADSSRSSSKTFLGMRGPRPCVKVDSETYGTFYICRAIDNFHLDVESSVLNQRGWVLQERALSRRIIHFTSSQLYWECGKVIRCETLAELFNSKASFLSDSDFPASALDYYKGGRIFFFQDLYEKYSRLSFTNQKDRPVAISGLEKRIVRSFGTKGGYGIFKSYLHRGILWQRTSDSSLARITYHLSHQVPSWSWMAYKGGITYMKIPFNKVQWTDDLFSPFKSITGDQSQQHWGQSNDMKSCDLQAMARKLNIGLVDLRTRVIFDDVNEVEQIDIKVLRCVVVGRAKHEEQKKNGQTHWVLVIKPLFPGTQPDTYERAGVGSLSSFHISEEKASLVHIQ